MKEIILITIGWSIGFIIGYFCARDYWRQAIKEYKIKKRNKNYDN